ncbi:MAG: trypsin-like peptidase domain-containing protein [Pirellulales bacterium]
MKPIALMLSHLLILTAPAWAAAPPEVVLQAEAERVEVIAKARAAAVCVFAREGQGGGSGVVISPDGYALSNFHVTKPAGNAIRCGMLDGRVYDAVIVSVDPTGDVALIKLFGRDDFPHAELADSDTVRVGDWAFAVGNPFLLANDLAPTVTYGIVSGVHRYQYPAGTILEYTDCIQTDAAINPGNSGGPLFNAQGQLIGINGRASFEKRGRVNVGVGYAISINQIKNFLGYLKSGRIVDHASLGATVRTDFDGRVVVDQILDDSDAYRRGMRRGDEIVRFAGRSITTVNSFKNVLGILPQGWRVPLTYRRDGQSHDCLVRLAALHHEGELAEAVRSGPTPSPDEGPDEQPEGPQQPLPLPTEPAPSAEMPEIVAQHFEARAGYTNYFFNQSNRQRVWDAFTARGDFSGLTTGWMLTGETPTGEMFTVELADEEGAIRLPEGESLARFDDVLSAATKPGGSGGLLAALHLWRRLLLVGPAEYGEVYYLGTAPLPGRAELVDVLVGNHAGIETTFYFDPSLGDLVAVEMFGQYGADPCEIYFDDIREIEGRHFPHRLEVRHGDIVYAVLEVKEVAFERPVEN